MLEDATGKTVDLVDFDEKPQFIKLDKVAKTKKPIFCLMIYGFCLLNIWDSGISITTLTGTQSNGKNFYTFF